MRDWLLRRGETAGNILKTSRVLCKTRVLQISHDQTVSKWRVILFNGKQINDTNLFDYQFKLYARTRSDRMGSSRVYKFRVSSIINLGDTNISLEQT